MTRNPSERLATLYTYLAGPHRGGGRPFLEPCRPTGQQIQRDLRREYSRGSAGRKMLQRDLDTLRASGVEVDRGHRVDGHRTYAVVTTSRPPLDPPALAALTDIDDHGGPMTTIVAKLGGRVRRPVGVPSAVPAGVRAALDPVDEVTAALDEALHQQRLISFDYAGRHYRDVEPTGLVRCGGWTYLTAKVDRSVERRFRTDRFEKVALGAAFTPPPEVPGLPPPPWQFDTASATRTALIRFDPTVARAAAARFGGLEALTAPDGAVTLAVFYNDPGRLVRAVLEFADRAEIVHPQPLRDHMISYLGAWSAPAEVVR